MQKNATSRILITAALAITIAALGTNASAQTPTVNGLFYGDGDDQRYPAAPYDQSEYGSNLYLTLINDTLYVALVVDRSVNDNVFTQTNGQGSDPNATDYLASAGWGGGGNLSALRRMDSEFAEFNFTVGTGTNEQTFTWQQGYAGPSDGSHDFREADWISDTTVAGGLGTPPPGLESASSLMWNLNTYATLLANGSNAWEMPGTATDAKTWKSPWKNAGMTPASGDPTTVIDAGEGYPSSGPITYSPTYQWEWAMVYEWAVDMSQFGETPVFVVTGASHHSPSKTGDENDDFPPPSGDPEPLSDFGDLPDSFGTLLASDGARHSINTGSTVQLGANLDSEPDGQPTSAADGDDTTSINDDDGVNMPADTSSDGDGSDTVLTVTVTATNESASPAQLCGWYDLDQSGSFNNLPNTSTTSSDPDSGSGTDNGERSCVTVPAGTVNEEFKVAWSKPAALWNTVGTFSARFRISTDAGMFDASLLSPTGAYAGGEVEDCIHTVTTNPVSIASFASRYTTEGLEVDWSTVSETRNAGFYLWGDRGDGMELLTEQAIPAQEGDVLTPRSYSLVIPGVLAGEIDDLALTAVDYSGDEEVYGLFAAGETYGEAVRPAPIAWEAVRGELKQRQQAHAAAAKRSASVQSARRSDGNTIDHVDVRITEPGLQSVSWQMLADAGLDLTGVKAGDIAVTLKGEPVSRHVVDGKPAGRAPRSALRAAGRVNERGVRFGPGGAIRFWGEAPEMPDALYVDAYVYRIAVDADRARAAGRSLGRAVGGADAYLEWVREDADNGYHLASPMSDPWYAARLRADRTNAYETTLLVDDALLSDRPARLQVTIGGLTDYDVAPDHRAVIEVNGQQVEESIFDGQAVKDLAIDVPAGLLRPGANTVTVRAPGGTAAPFDIFLVDTIALGYPRPMAAADDRIVIEGATGDGVRASGFSAETLAYAFDGEELVWLPQSVRDGTVAVPTVEDRNATYWLSTADRLAVPEVVAARAGIDLFDGAPANFLIVGHPAFLPVSGSENHPLNDYLDQRRADGWLPRVFDIGDIQAVYGGMPLPGALTTFLNDAEAHFGYEHVLLVGGDSYDYTDNLGLGSVSFIPTKYAATTFIPHTPADALLADLDGDGLSDKAIGRWPVRTQGDLEAIVAKTLAWPELDNPESAVWVTDIQDGRSGSYNAQADRMIGLLENAGWSPQDLDRVYFDRVRAAPGMSVADSARERLFSVLEQGRSLTGFVGHGSPSMWTFQGLLKPDDLAELNNDGRPTLVGTMTCYTSYFVSPHGDTVGHRWMNGYREDAFGDRIPGAANGAVAVHGAATLSDYGKNEVFMQRVLEAQLQGATLGSAIKQARRDAHEQGIRDLVTNWTLLGDPTLVN